MVILFSRVLCFFFLLVIFKNRKICFTQDHSSFFFFVCSCLEVLFLFSFSFSVKLSIECSAKQRLSTPSG